MTFGYNLPPIVVDASAAIEFLAGDPGWSDNFVEWAKSERALLAPVHFPAEVANGQLKGRRLAVTTIIGALDRLAAAGIETTDRGTRGLIESIALANQHSLTVYDALYLQLALDVDGELATLDADLRRAAMAEGLPIVS